MIQNVTVTLPEKSSTSPNGSISDSQIPLVTSQEPTNLKASSTIQEFHAKSGAYYKAWQKMLAFNI